MGEVVEPEIVDISYVYLGVAAGMMVVDGIVARALKLELGWDLFISSARCAAQLLAIGYILEEIFALSNPWAVFGISIVMCFLAAVESSAKTSYHFKGMIPIAFGAILFASSTVLVFGITVVIGVNPWWLGQYFIPILGMMLGNTLSAVALGIDKLLSSYATNKDIIECYIAKGATRREASKKIISQATAVGLKNIIINMGTVGVVYIPGMMAGQVLAGIQPDIAARYQITILYLLTSSIMVGLLISLALTNRVVFHSHDELTLQKLVRRKGKGRPDWIRDVILAIYGFFKKCCGYCCSTEEKYGSLEDMEDDVEKPLPADAVSTVTASTAKM